MTHAMAESFKDNVAQGIAESVGSQPSDVNVSLRAGSVRVDATVSVPRSAALNVALMLKDESPLSRNVIERVKTVPNIQSVTVGMLTADSVSGISVHIVSESSDDRPGSKGSTESTGSADNEGALAEGSVWFAVAAGCGFLLCSIAMICILYRQRLCARIGTNMGYRVSDKVSDGGGYGARYSNRQSGRLKPTSSGRSDINQVSSTSMTERSSLALARTVPLPPGKKYHFFVSHKKKHSTQSNVSEMLGLLLHETLTERGLVGFFDVDDLQVISKQCIIQGVLDSCTLLIIVNDETCQSEWCRLEWETAREHGIPVKCIVNINVFDKDVVLAEVAAVNDHLLKYPWTEFTQRQRKQVANELFHWVMCRVQEEETPGIQSAHSDHALAEASQDSGGAREKQHHHDSRLDSPSVSSGVLVCKDDSWLTMPCDTDTSSVLPCEPKATPARGVSKFTAQASSDNV